MPETTDENERPESFIRWQGITIAQLTVAINIILGFSGASLVFAANLLIKDDFQVVGWAGATFLISFFTLLLSMGFGVWCVITHLLDFRVTTQAAKLREAKAPAADIKSLRARYRRLDKRAWRLFWWQIATFFAGFVLMIIGVGGSTSNKLACTLLVL